MRSLALVGGDFFRGPCGGGGVHVSTLLPPNQRKSFHPRLDSLYWVVMSKKLLLFFTKLKMGYSEGSTGAMAPFPQLHKQTFLTVVVPLHDQLLCKGANIF